MKKHLLVGATAAGTSRNERMPTANVTAIIVATGASGTPSVLIQLEASMDDGASWVIVTGPSNITANGQYKLSKPTGEFYETYRLNITQFTGTLIIDGWLGGGPE